MPSGNINRLTILQKRAIRCVFNSKYNCHTDPLFKAAKVLKLEDLYVNQCLIYYWKSKLNLLPTNLTKIILKPCSHHATRNELNVLPLINLEVGRQMFLYKIVSVLQNQPTHIKMLYHNRSVGHAKRKLKLYLLSTYNINCNIVNCFSCSL